MYLTRLKTAVVEALQSQFDSNPTTDFRSVQVGIEFPLTPQAYPGIWVNYDDRDSLVIAGIDHKEYVLDTNNIPHEVTRWKFAGEVSLTIVALSSMERDNLYDELVRMLAFGRIETPTDNFRTRIEHNDFLAMVANWDNFRPGGDSAAPGTPWGTDNEVIYERSLSFDVIGEFVSDPSTADVVLLSAVLAQGVRNGDLPVELPDVPINGPSQAFDPTHWH